MRVRLGNGSYPYAEFRVNIYLTLSVGTSGVGTSGVAKSRDTPFERAR